MKYCSNCGAELKEGADICLNCGKMLNKQPQTKVKTKTPGKSKGIVSLVLGIIAMFWTLSMILGIENGTETLVVESTYSEIGVAAYFISYYIGYTLFALTPGIVGLVFGIKSTKEQQNGKATSGIILASIALVACLFVLIKFAISL